MSETVIQRAAGRVRKQIIAQSDDTYFPSVWQCEQIVRETLAALSEPSVKMIEAGARVIRGDSTASLSYYSKEARAVFNEMVSAALKEGEGK